MHHKNIQSKQFCKQFHCQSLHALFDCWVTVDVSSRTLAMEVVGFHCEKMTILTAVERGLCFIFQTSIGRTLMMQLQLGLIIHRHRRNILCSTFALCIEGSMCLLFACTNATNCDRERHSSKVYTMPSIYCSHTQWHTQWIRFLSLYNQSAKHSQHTHERSHVYIPWSWARRPDVSIIVVLCMVYLHSFCFTVLCISLSWSWCVTWFYVLHFLYCIIDIVLSRKHHNLIWTPQLHFVYIGIWWSLLWHNSLLQANHGMTKLYCYFDNEVPQVDIDCRVPLVTINQDNKGNRCAIVIATTHSSCKQVMRCKGSMVDYNVLWK